MPRTTMIPGSPQGSPDGRRRTSNVVSQQPIRPRSTRLDGIHRRLRRIRRQLFREPRSPVGVNEIFFDQYTGDEYTGGRRRRRRSRKKGRKSRKSRRRNKRKSRKKRKSRRRKRKSRRKSRRRR